MATTTAIPSRHGSSAHGPRSAAKRRGVDLLPFLLPALVLFTLAITLPAIFYSFNELDRFGEWDFVGLINYQALFSDPAELPVHLRVRGCDGGRRQRHRLPPRGRA